MTLRIITLLLAAVVLGGCAGAFRPEDFRTWQVTPRAEPAPVVDFHGIPVRSGQIIVSEQGSARSVLMTLMVARPYQYIHAGLVVVEEGRPYVYEAYGRTGIFLYGAPPTDGVHGGIRRVPLEDFIRIQRFVAIYDPPPGIDVTRVVAYARTGRQSGLPFDPYFDQRDPTRVYCTEFVALALEAGGAPPPATIPMSDNASLRVVNHWLRVDSPVMVPAESLIAGGTQTALLSQYHSPAQIKAYFALKAELHRRFTPDQTVGNVFTFSAFSGLEFRQEVRNYMNAVNQAATGWNDASDAQIDEQVRLLAATMLGPFDSAQTNQSGQDAG